MLAKDYTVYNQQYQYMDRLLKQVSDLSRQSEVLYRGAVGKVSEDSAFLRTFKEAQSQAELNAPESMDAIFEEAAREYDVPLKLLKAIGKAESNFNADAVSGAGAQGVMQLMPATAKALGVTDPFDARSNIMGGAKYISDKLKQYNGDIELALAAYNAGSGNVRKYGGVPPFKETRNYIRKIKEYMGTDITIDKTVDGRSRQSGKNQPGVVTGTGSSIASALYLIELMRMQMQSRMFVSDLTFTDGEEGLL